MKHKQSKKIIQGFWETLPRPFFCLAPMADVTDQVFRKIIAKYSRHSFSKGGPDVFWTEFVSADGLQSLSRKKLLVDLVYEEKERPIVAQIFGSNTENMRKTAQLCCEIGFDGIDINMGCPDKVIEKQGCGAGHIKNKTHALEIISAVKEGVLLSGISVPVSVKTRIGYNNIEIDEWLSVLLQGGITTLIVHMRTRKEMSKASAHWDLMPRIIALRNKISPETLVVGNGDVISIRQGESLAHKTGCDGVMLGRAIFGNPWLFDACKKNISIEEKLKVMIEHTYLYEKILGSYKNFSIMKKHYKAYANGFDGAKELRVALMSANTAREIEIITKNFLNEKCDFNPPIE